MKCAEYVEGLAGCEATVFEIAGKNLFHGCHYTLSCNHYPGDPNKHVKRLSDIIRQYGR